MNLLENISLAFASLRAGKMRALLTMLGIIIGVGSVIAIVTLGDSLTGSLTSSMSTFGVNNIMVNIQERGNESDGPGGGRGGGGTGGGSAVIQESDQITMEMIEGLMQTYPDELAAVSLTQNAGTGQIQDGRLYANISIAGANNGYKDANNIELLDGRFISDIDVRAGRNVAVISDRARAAIFGSGVDPLEQEIRVYTADQILTYLVIGVYKYEATAFFGTAASEDVRTDLYIPVTTAKRLAGTGESYQSLTVTTAPGADARAMVRSIESYFDRHYQNNTRFTVSAMSMESMLGTMTTMLSTVQIAIGAIAAISLLVGGIGVMNIMLVSVTERTREIGTRKALGARNSAIRLQFVVESMIICLIGGIIGILLGLGMGAGGSMLLGFPAEASITIILIAVAFSMLIGVFFGYYPANKASKLDPIEALRYE